MNNRELVTLVYLGLLPLLALLVPGARSALLDVVKMFFTSKVGLIWAVFICYMTLVIWGMPRIDLWDSSLVGSTLLWLILVGFAWLFNINDAGKEPNFMRRRVFEAVGVAAVLEVYVNLEVMHLLAEFAFQAFIIFVALLNVVAKQEARFKPVARLTSTILVLAGFGMFIYTTIELILHRSSLDYSNILNQLLLPIWLTIAALPCIFLIALYAGYEVLFLHLRFRNDDRWPPLGVLVGVAAGLGGSFTSIDRFKGKPAKEAAHASSFKAAHAAVKTFKRERAADEAARNAARQRLIDNAGVKGVDTEGLQLDRREFAATKAALDWLATCQMGWYRRDDGTNRYKKDLLEVLGDFMDKGLPEPHNIVLKVRRDGQAWYAYRVTPSGYVFGIGASAAPLSQWHYAGPKPPGGFPSKAGGWTSFDQLDPPEWKEEDPT